MLIAHISDLHLRSFKRVRPRDFANQRLLGGLNLLLNRGPEFPVELLDCLAEDLRRVRPDHILVSGDVSNLALPSELEAARDWIAGLGVSSEDVTVVPGNHDAYTAAAVERDEFGRALGAMLHGDLSLPGGPRPFPLVRLRHNVAIVALSTARASAPGLAIGTLGESQLAAAERILRHDALRGRFRVVVLHHPPRSPYAKWHQRLTDGPAFMAMIGRVGAELIVHGHLHRPCRDELPGGAAGPVRVVGVTSSVWMSPDPARRASYNLYEIAADAPRLERIATRRYDSEARAYVD